MVTLSAPGSIGKRGHLLKVTLQKWDRVEIGTRDPLMSRLPAELLTWSRMGDAKRSGDKDPPAGPTSVAMAPSPPAAGGGAEPAPCPRGCSRPLSSRTRRKVPTMGDRAGLAEETAVTPPTSPQPWAWLPLLSVRCPQRRGGAGEAP